MCILTENLKAFFSPILQQILNHFKGEKTSENLVDYSSESPVNQTNNQLNDAVEELKKTEQFEEILTPIPENPPKDKEIYSPIYYQFSYPKTGNTEEECEDKGKIKYNADRLELLAAISDGVSSASFSGEWADILVNAFIDSCTFNQPPEITNMSYIQQWVDQSQENWLTFINQRSLNWIAQRKLAKDGGSYATFLGLRLSYNRDVSQFKCEIFSVGDCCLFLVQNNELDLSFPLSHSENLPIIPDQIGTSSSYNQSLQSRIKGISQLLTPENQEFSKVIHFYLVTDALAGWILTSLKKEENPWEKLNQFEINHLQEFKQWIDELRNDREIRDDDTTLIHIIYK